MCFICTLLPYANVGQKCTNQQVQLKDLPLAGAYMCFWSVRPHLQSKSAINRAFTLRTDVSSRSCISAPFLERERQPIRRQRSYWWFYSISIVIPIIALSLTSLALNTTDNRLQAIPVPCDEGPRLRWIPDYVWACCKPKICQLISWLKSSH